ncbi:hypothetical protein EPR50_G00106300 [Perca flavescens]|uniref:Uncharacterized protein n=1 Tax=Perca flavescens TaxID=8167 RepID=A0A484CWV5_PERFV|nr:hypothetical protein EPR50_G00106300 [Perca flavescens]
MLGRSAYMLHADQSARSENTEGGLQCFCSTRPPPQPGFSVRQERFSSGYPVVQISHLSETPSSSALKPQPPASSTL